MDEGQQEHGSTYEKFEAPIEINIGNVCDGAMIDAFALELRKVLANINDPNTEAKKTREVRMVLKLHPKEDRVQINVEFECTSKIAPMIPATSRIFMGKDAEGFLYALSEDPRQMHIFAKPKPREVAPPIEFKAAK